MKKIFILVALAVMFASMGFSFKTKKTEKAKLEWCDTVGSACTGAANDSMNDYGYSSYEANCYFLECITVNGC